MACHLGAELQHCTRESTARKNELDCVLAAAMQCTLSKCILQCTTAFYCNGNSLTRPDSANRSPQAATLHLSTGFNCKMHLSNFYLAPSLLLHPDTSLQLNCNILARLPNKSKPIHETRFYIADQVSPGRQILIIHSNIE